MEKYVKNTISCIKIVRNGSSGKFDSVCRTVSDIMYILFCIKWYCSGK